MPFIEKVFWDHLILVLGTYVMFTLIAFVLVSCWFGYWTWKHLRSNYALAPQIAVGAALIVLAQLLIIHNQLKVQGSEIEVRRNEEMREAEKKTVPEEAAKQETDKSSPEYVEQKLRTWLEKARLGIHHVVMVGKDNIMVELQNRFLLDETITRADLYERLFLLQKEERQLSR